MIGSLGFHNRYRLQGWYRGRLIWQRDYVNLVTNEMLNAVLNSILGGSALPSKPWYMGLIDNAGFVALAGTDTATKITTTSPGGGNNGWKEATQYSEGFRRTMVFGTSAAQSIDNVASPVTFTANANFSLYGLFLANAPGIGATTGILFGEAESTQGIQSVTSGQTITGTATITDASV